MIIAVIKLVKSAKHHHIFYLCVICGAGAISFILPHVTAEVMALSVAPIIGEVTRKQLNKGAKARQAIKKHHAHMHHDVSSKSTANEMHGSE